MRFRRTGGRYGLGAPESHGCWRATRRDGVQPARCDAKLAEKAGRLGDAAMVARRILPSGEGRPEEDPGHERMGRGGRRPFVFPGRRLGRLCHDDRT